MKPQGAQALAKGWWSRSAREFAIGATLGRAVRTSIIERLEKYLRAQPSKAPSSGLNVGAVLRLIVAHQRTPQSAAYAGRAVKRGC